MDKTSCLRRSRASAVPGSGHGGDRRHRRRHLSITQRRKLGAAFVPEERLGHGTAPRMRLSENALLTGHAPAAWCGMASSTPRPR